MRFLALGDSYTIGEGVPPQDSWPFLLADELRRLQIDIEDPVVIAKTGWTTGELLAAIREQNPQGPFDLVTLMIGVNNQYRGSPIEVYENEFKELLVYALNTARRDPEGVVAVSIPDWSVTPFAEGRDKSAISSQINACNLAARSVCMDARVAFVDITQMSRAAKDDRELLAEDGLHPSRRMHAQWCRIILPFVLKSLQRS